MVKLGSKIRILTKDYSTLQQVFSRNL